MRTFLGGIAALLILSFALTPAQAQEKTQGRKPNILIILADDLGYADVGFQGAKNDIRTPNIDALAKKAVRFTSGYVSGPYCSPTRAGLLTGRYQNRFGHEFNPAGNQQGLPVTETTLANRLRALGYATGLVGKWHLGSHAQDASDGPRLPGVLRLSRRGPFLHQRRRHPAQHRARQGKRISDRCPGPGGVQLHRSTRQGAVLPLSCLQRRAHADGGDRKVPRALSRHQEGPTPHLRGHALSHGRRHRQGPGQAAGKGPRRGHADILLQRQRRPDHGGHDHQRLRSTSRCAAPNASFWKAASACRSSWPGRASCPAGKTYDQPIIALDVYPTALAAAGQDDPGRVEDRRRQFAAVSDRGRTSRPPHETLFWRFGNSWRCGRATGTWSATTTPACTFTTSRTTSARPTTSPQTNPQKLQELKTAWDRWNAEMVPPLWGGGKKIKGAAGFGED